MMNESGTPQQTARAKGADTPTFAPVTSLLTATFDGNDSPQYASLPRIEVDDEVVVWYPMRIRHSNVRKAFDIRDALGALGFTTYLRVTHSEVVADGEIRDVWRPMLNNLIFVRIRKKIMRELKNTNMLLHALQFYAKVKTEKTKKADIITVSDRDMQKFIDAELREDPMRQRIPLTVGEYLAKPGRPVRICRGPFAGIEGEIKTIKSHRIVVVKIAELGLANGITHVPKEDLEFLVTPSQS